MYELVPVTPSTSYMSLSRYLPHSSHPGLLPSLTPNTAPWPFQLALLGTVHGPPPDPSMRDPTNSGLVTNVMPQRRMPRKFIPTPTTLEDREVWCATVHGVCCKESDTTRLNQSHCIVVTFDTTYLYSQISCLLICFLASCLVSAPQDVIVIGYWCSSCYFLCVILSAFMCIYMKSLQGLHWRKNYSSSVLKLETEAKTC